MEIALETINLTKKYTNKVVAVDKLNLEIGKGEIFGLLGPNGAGKTTTGGMLSTRILPSSGTAYIGGIDVVKHPAEVKHEIGVVPQTNTLDRSLSVEQNLYFHGRYFGFSRSDSKMRTEDLLRQFRLSERADAPVTALSGGMAQRLMLARAVFHSPTVLILDEPTSGLDPQSRLALWDVLGELHTRGQTILLTTHYMEEADHLCQRLAIMDHGKILALGTPNQLKSNLGSGSTLWVEANRDSSTYIEKLQSQDLLSTKYTLRATGKGVTIIGNAITEIISTVTRTIESEGLSIVSLKVEEPTLETVFISLTGRDLRE
jgi:ABC-2 type transport system ATP-binding protein